MGCAVTASLILAAAFVASETSSWRLHLYSGKQGPRHPLPERWVCSSASLDTLEKKNSLAPARNRIRFLGLPALSLATILSNKVTRFMPVLIGRTVTVLPNLPPVYRKQSSFRCLKLMIYTWTYISFSHCMQWDCVKRDEMCGTRNTKHVTQNTSHPSHLSLCSLTACIIFHN